MPFKITPDLIENDDVTIDTNASGDIVLTSQDSGVSLTVDESAAVSNIGGVETYPSLSDAPTTLSEGTVIYVEDENKIYVEDGT